MAYTSIQQYMTDGVTTQYSFPFPYLEGHPEFIHVYTEQMGEYAVADPDTRVDLEFLMPAPNTIQLRAVPEAGLRLTIQRWTFADALLVAFEDGSMPSKNDFDTMALQLLHVAQEARDANGQAIHAAIAFFDAIVDRFEELQREVEESLASALQQLATIIQLIRDMQALYLQMVKARDDAIAAAKAAEEVVKTIDAKIQAAVDKLKAEMQDLYDELVTSLTSIAANLKVDLQALKDAAELARAKAEEARDAAKAEAERAWDARDEAEDFSGLAQRWANETPNVPVGTVGGNPEFSSKHYAALAQAVSNLSEHVRAYDPHPQYLRKDGILGNMFLLDENGDYYPNPNYNSVIPNNICFLDANQDVAFFEDPEAASFIPDYVPGYPNKLTAPDYAHTYQVMNFTQMPGFVPTAIPTADTWTLGTDWVAPDDIFAGIVLEVENTGLPDGAKLHWALRINGIRQFVDTYGIDNTDPNIVGSPKFAELRQGDIVAFEWFTHFPVASLSLGGNSCVHASTVRYADPRGLGDGTSDAMERPHVEVTSAAPDSGTETREPFTMPDNAVYRAIVEGSVVDDATGAEYPVQFDDTQDGKGFQAYMDGDEVVFVWNGITAGSVGKVRIAYEVGTP